MTKTQPNFEQLPYWALIPIMVVCLVIMTILAPVIFAMKLKEL